VPCLDLKAESAQLNWARAPLAVGWASDGRPSSSREQNPVAGSHPRNPSCHNFSLLSRLESGAPPATSCRRAARSGRRSGWRSLALPWSGNPELLFFLLSPLSAPLRAAHMEMSTEWWPPVAAGGRCGTAAGPLAGERSHGRVRAPPSSSSASVPLPARARRHQPGAAVLSHQGCRGLAPAPRVDLCRATAVVGGKTLVGPQPLFLARVRIWLCFFDLHRIDSSFRLCSIRFVNESFSFLNRSTR